MMVSYQNIIFDPNGGFYYIHIVHVTFYDGLVPIIYYPNGGLKLSWTFDNIILNIDLIYLFFKYSICLLCTIAARINFFIMQCMNKDLA